MQNARLYKPQRNAWDGRVNPFTLVILDSLFTLNSFYAVPKVEEVSRGSPSPPASEGLFGSIRMPCRALPQRPPSPVTRFTTCRQCGRSVDTRRWRVKRTRLPLCTRHGISAFDDQAASDVAAASIAPYWTAQEVNAGLKPNAQGTSSKASACRAQSKLYPMLVHIGRAQVFSPERSRPEHLHLPQGKAFLQGSTPRERREKCRFGCKET